MHACMHLVVCVYECIPNLWFITAADACTDVHVCIKLCSVYHRSNVLVYVQHVIVHLVHVYIP